MNLKRITALRLGGRSQSETFLVDGSGEDVPGRSRTSRPCQNASTLYGRPHKMLTLRRNPLNREDGGWWIRELGLWTCLTMRIRP